VETQVLSGTQLSEDLSGVLAIGPKRLKEQMILEVSKVIPESQMMITTIIVY